MRKNPSRPLRRFALGALALAMLCGPAAASGCAGGFAPISEIDGLRVLSVQASSPYAEPGETVKLTMTWADSREGAKAPQILWIGGCFNPPGDAYYGCYEQLAAQLQGLAENPGELIASGIIGIGNTFSVRIPDRIIEDRPKPADGAPWYGIGYVFFMACAGELGPVEPEGTSAAGYFPVGCYDRPYTEEGAKRLGADSFVPGYTQIYAFADKRPNENPVIDDMTLDGKPITVGIDTAPEVEACPVSEGDRLGPPGCGKADPFKECTTYEISITVPDDVGEIDPSGSQPDGAPLRETVWVDYFADRGNFNGDARLVSDAIYGIRDDLSVKWIAPQEPGPVRIWAVIHDNRGGQSVVERYLNVK